MSIGIGLALLGVLTLIYRMIRFSKKERSVKIVSHEEESHDDDNTFEIRTSERGVLEQGDNVYSFSLMYNGLTFIGKYVY